MNASDSPLALDAPLHDLNAVGGHEPRFPLKVVVLIAVALLAALMVLVYVLRTHFPLSTQKKEELPSSSLLASAPPLLTAEQARQKALQAGVDPDDESLLEASPSAADDAALTSPSARNASAQKSVPAIVPQALPAAQTAPESATSTAKATSTAHGAAAPVPIVSIGNASSSLSGASPVSRKDRYGGEIMLDRQTRSPEAGGVGSASSTADTGHGGWPAWMSGLAGMGGRNPQGAGAVPPSAVPPGAVPPGATPAARTSAASPAGLASPGGSGMAPLLEKLLAQQNAQQGGMPAGGSPAGGPMGAGPGSGAASALGVGAFGNSQASIGSMLSGSKTDKVYAARTLNENLTLPKGTQIDCALTTRVVTEISGFASCMVTEPVYSANGRLLLVEKMTEVLGEYAASSMQPGQRHLHILWTRLRKPGGITVELASPASDGLGGAGIAGLVDNRWTERIGGAFLLSFVKDFVTYKTSIDANGGGSNVLANSAAREGSSLAEKLLDSTIKIRPVLYAQQGARVAIYVARDLDFSNVYEIQRP